ncbi:MAG: winged helix DNA-binding domain-containing protein [Myxococcota bacterium]|nr:winged helix DNA-binding domain-containing protein [Myxococcota bacterium]
MELSAAEARRLAIAAQGLAERPEGLLAMVRQLGVVQLDSVNVLARSHYLVAFARLGAYDPAAFDRLSHEAPRDVFEYWGHEASLLPVELQPALRWRMANAKHDAWGRMRAIAKKRKLVGKVLAAIAEKGPVRAGEIEVATKPKSERGWWAWSEAKTAIEWLFWSGQVTAASRRQFERLYDLPERVLPAAIVGAPMIEEHDAHRLLVERASKALGVATEADLRDYYRLPLASSRAAVAELASSGTLVRASVEGWAKPAFVHRDVEPPHTVDAHALLSPFDSLIWTRERTERMFGMKFRLEVYTPAPKRVHGYYVLPFLLGDALVARVDLKADRAAQTLRVQAAHLEPKQKAKLVAPALMRELRAMADWMKLEHVVVAQRGDLATTLARGEK